MMTSSVAPSSSSCVGPVVTHAIRTERPTLRERRAQQSTSRYIKDRFGTRLRQLRTSRRLSQTDMAVAFGIDRSFISDVERGRKAIGLPILEVIAIGFDVTIAELLKEL
jgi:ribosome-binding protein aMBF1 (putative translation factor)